MPRKPPLVNAVIDYETDPFRYGRIPKPFVCGFYCAGNYVEFWGEDCVLQLILWLDVQPVRYRLFAHNGGKFDFFFMLEYLDNPIKIINGRIVKAQLGRHEVRDSYAIIPMPLEGYAKEKIDYAKFEREVRHLHRAEIGAYLKSDCKYLYDLVDAFWQRFGDKITIGSTAIAELKKLHPFDHTYESHDQLFRPFYFGGRVEAFETGILRDDFKVYDTNSMYPYVMAQFDHPTGSQYRSSYSAVMDKKGRMSGLAQYPVYLAHIECQQDGAFPTRRKDAPLDFSIRHGEFHVTSHELKAALATGRVSQVKVLRVYAPEKVIRFGAYVDKFMAEKIAAKKSGDKIAEIFAKFLLNSAYGKFGTNPDHYKDYWLQQSDEDIPNEPYQLASTHQGGINLWEKESATRRYFDVATAASITGAARSVLLAAIARAERPVYCDTDSIICRALNLPKDNSALGAWKLEGEGDTLAIAGKKLYALRAGREYVKTASKGVRLTGPQIFDLAKGKDLEWFKDSPSFSLSRPTTFIHRKLVAKRA